MTQCVVFFMEVKREATQSPPVELHSKLISVTRSNPNLDVARNLTKAMALSAIFCIEFIDTSPGVSLSLASFCDFSRFEGGDSKFLIRNFSTHFSSKRICLENAKLKYFNTSIKKSKSMIYSGLCN